VIFIHHADEKPAFRWSRYRAAAALPKLPSSGRNCGLQLRHLIYGGSRNPYRIIYQIDESHKVVGIVTIRHGAMDEFSL
jgi:hypothetical protein